MSPSTHQYQSMVTWNAFACTLSCIREMNRVHATTYAPESVPLAAQPQSTSSGTSLTANPPPEVSKKQAFSLRSGSHPPIERNSSCWHLTVRFFLSLRFVLLFLAVSSLIIVSVLSWRLTFDGANTSIALVTDELSTAIVDQLDADLSRRFHAVEHITAINRAHFESGVMGTQTGSTAQYLAMKNMYAQVKELISDTVSSMTYTTNLGEMNGFGWILPTQNAANNYIVQWDQIGLHLYEHKLAPNATKLEITYESTASNSTFDRWYTIIDVSDSNSAAWTPVYLWQNIFYLSQSRPIYDGNQQFLGVTTADMQLGFIDTIAKGSSLNSEVGTQLIILDADSGFVLGTSITGFNLLDTSDPNNYKGVYLFSPNSPELLLTVHNFIMKQSGRDDTVTPVNQLYSNLPLLRGEQKVGSSTLLLTVKPYAHAVDVSVTGTASTIAWSNSHSINWVLVHVIDRSEIASAIQSSNTRVLASVLSICLGFIILFAFILFGSMKRIQSLSHLLSSFSHFDFREHVEGGQLKQPSRLTELADMQEAVMEMTRAFKQHLDTRNTLLRRADASEASVLPLQSQVSTVATTVGISSANPRRSTQTIGIIKLPARHVDSVDMTNGLPPHIPSPVPVSPLSTRRALAISGGAGSGGIIRFSANIPSSVPATAPLQEAKRDGSSTGEV